MWPAIEERSLSRYFDIIDEFPDPIGATSFLFSTNILHIFEVSKYFRDFFVANITFYGITQRVLSEIHQTALSIMSWDMLLRFYLLYNGFESLWIVDS